MSYWGKVWQQDLKVFPHTAVAARHQRGIAWYSIHFLHSIDSRTPVLIVRPPTLRLQLPTSINLVRNFQTNIPRICILQNSDSDKLTALSIIVSSFYTCTSNKTSVSYFSLICSFSRFIIFTVLIIIKIK